MDEKAKNKQIVKNTIVLYIRTIVILIVSLFTSRVVLNTLGVEDFGIYNVVGGVVTMFSLLTSSLNTTISRFITTELGKGNIERLKNIFSTSVNVQILIAIAIGLILELVGIWFLNNKMQIPADRMFAANIVMHCSIATFIINLISIPYNSCIIAHERMTAFAYISILETVLKLCSVLLLYIQFFDNLIVYAILLMLTSIIIRIVNGVYCSRNFEECKYKVNLEKPLLKEMTSMASWNLVSSSATVINNQGINVIINLFFGVTVNAARGIAVQVEGAILQFANNFTTALNPQITKSYAAGDYKRMRNLVFKGSRLSFYLLFIISLPVMIEAPTILKLWLNIVPEHTVVFVRFALTISLITIITRSLYVVSMATGNIKRYQTVVGSLSLLTFILTYICYKIGAKVEATYIIAVIIEISIMIARVIIVNKLVYFGVINFFKSVVLRIVLVVAISLIVPLLVKGIMPASTIRLILEIFICLSSAALSILYIGMNNSERNYAFKMIGNRL